MLANVGIIYLTNKIIKNNDEFINNIKCVAFDNPGYPDEKILNKFNLN